MGDRDRVDVDVGHAAARVRLLGDLMGVAVRGDTGADIQKLPDPGTDQVPYRAAQKRSVAVRHFGQVGHQGHRLGGGLPIHGEVVPTAE